MTAPVEGRSYRGRRQIEVTEAQLLPRVTGLLRDGFRLALMAAHEDLDRYRIVYLFVAAGPDRRVELVLCTDRETPSIPSLASVSFSAGTVRARDTRPVSA